MKIHKIKGLLTSIYMINYPKSKKLLLLDSGCSYDFKSINKLINTYNYNYKNLTVVTTHSHSDHMGSAFKWYNLGINIIAPKDINSWYQGYCGLFMKRVDTSLGRYLYSLNNNVKYPILNAFHEFLFTSEKFYYPNYINANFLDISIYNNVRVSKLSNDFPDWEAHLLPGHTSHMIGLYNKNKKIFYVSDSIILLNSKIKSPIPVDFPKLHINTLDYIKSVDIQHLLLAHGGYINIIDNDENINVLNDVPIDLTINKQDFNNIIDNLKIECYNQQSNYNFKKNIIELLFFPHYFNSEIKRVKRFISNKTDFF